MDTDSKKFWGPCCWKTIHSFAAKYTPSQKDAFVSFMHLLSELLPCHECRLHLRENLQRFPLTASHLHNRDTLFRWTYLLHDMVNRQLGKISPPYPNIKKAYFDGVGVNCSGCEVV